VGLVDAFAYGDLWIGLAAALLSRQTRQALGRLTDLARFVGHRVVRRAGRANRAPARPRRRPPDREEPEPAAWGGVLAFT
jgi:alkylated DNA nucleotide flippase Atl1